MTGQRLYLGGFSIIISSKQKINGFVPLACVVLNGANVIVGGNANNYLHVQFDNVESMPLIKIEKVIDEMKIQVLVISEDTGPGPVLEVLSDTGERLLIGGADNPASVEVVAINHVVVQPDVVS
jgi:hypothetical protein